MSKEVEPIQDEVASGERLNSVSAATRSRRLLKRLGIGLFLCTLIYLLSYGPMTMNALNRYGQTGGQRGAVLRLVYKPTHFLANHNTLYGDYRHFWVKRSRNYHWWARRNSSDASNVFLPPARRNRLSAKTRYQAPPD